MIYRRKRTIDGKVEMARLYRGRYRLDGETKITDVPLHTSDKRIAQQNLEKLVQQRQLEVAGMAPSAAQKAAQQTPLLHHLKDYLADLTTSGRDEKYIYIVEKQVRKLLQECRWSVLSDVTSDSFLVWRSKQRKAPKTLNEYLITISALLNWMERHERIEKNPLKHVQKVQTNGRQVRLRRALTDDEMKRLLAKAGPRKVVYLMAVYTGLRRAELAALVRSDLNLEAEQPFVNVRASTTKNHKQAILALHADLVSELKKLLEQLPPNENKLLAHLMPKMSVFKSDLKAAGIEFLNADGKRADFHSLRHTLATNLARAGTSPRIAMEVMRHSDIKLTTKTYTDAGLLPVADAVIKLPSLMRKARGTQIGTQSLFRVGHDQSTPGTETSAGDVLQALGIEQLEQDDSALVPTGQDLAKGSGGRARTNEHVYLQPLIEDKSLLCKRIHA
jgi:integrase